MSEPRDSIRLKSLNDLRFSFFIINPRRKEERVRYFESGKTLYRGSLLLKKYIMSRQNIKDKLYANLL